MAMSELKQKLLLYELAKIGFRDAQYYPVTDRLMVQPNNDRMPLINNAGDIKYGTEHDSLVIDTLQPIVRKVNEAVNEWERSSKMPFEELKQFRVLAEYNGIMMAARDDTADGRGLHFVTWQYNRDRTGLDYGHYTENYTAAKQDFAVRSGLIPEVKLFTQEQAAEIKASIEYRLNNDDELTISTENDLNPIAARLRAAYPGRLVEQHERFSHATRPDKEVQENGEQEIETHSKTEKTTDAVNNEIRPDDWVVVAPSDAFGNLVGKVVNITPSDSSEQAADVHISVADSGYSENEMNNIRCFIAGYGGEGASINDFIVSGDNLINITDIDPALRQRFIENGAEADAYCNQVRMAQNTRKKRKKPQKVKILKKHLRKKCKRQKKKSKHRTRTAVKINPIIGEKGSDTSCLLSKRKCGNRTPNAPEQLSSTVTVLHRTFSIN